MDELDQAIQAQFGPYGTNVGHGHVWSRPDGVRARCGGPNMCTTCARDAARVKTARDAVAKAQG